MEHFLSSFQTNSNTSQNEMTLLRGIILNDNIASKKDYFKQYLTEISKTESFPLSVLLLFCLDVHRDFKSDLTSKLKLLQKLNQSQKEQILSSFLTSLHYKENNSKELIYLKYNCILLNSLIDLIKKKIFTLNSTQYDIIFDYISLNYLNDNIEHLVKNLNEEIISILIFYFNCTMYIISINNNNNLHNILANIKDKIKNVLLNHKIEYSKRTRDFHFTFASLFFFIQRNLKENDESTSIEFLEYFSSNKIYEILIIYIKSYVNHFLNYNNVFDIQFQLLNNFINDIFIFNAKSPNTTKTQNLTLFEFYLLFLSHELKGKFSLLINDIFLISLINFHKINKDSTTQNTNEFCNRLISSSFLHALFSKMIKEKETFSFIEDNYFQIINSLYKLPSLQPQIGIEINNYFNSLITRKDKPLLNECQLLQLLPKETSHQSMISFIEYVFNFPFEKRDIPLLCELSKTFFECCFRNNKELFFSETFPKLLINYLMKLNLQDLKWFNNFLITLEKNNSLFYVQIIKQTYDLSKLNKEIYGVLFTLLKPFRLQKKSLLISNGSVALINKKLNINITISIKEIESILITNNTSLIQVILEFINEFDDFNQVFPLIKTVIKYNLKTSHLEYKSGVMKTIKVYFDCFIMKLVKIVNKTKKDENDVMFIKDSHINLINIFSFLNDNIYDRPYENLVSYLEIEKYLIQYVKRYMLEVKDNYKQNIEDFVNQMKSQVFNKGLCLSLISLLKHSWYFIRYYSFEILSNDEYTFIFEEMKNELLYEVKKYLFSLRQMDAEGSAYLFILLVKHLRSKIIESNQMNSLFNSNQQLDENNKEERNMFTIVNFLRNVINTKVQKYIQCLEQQKQSSNLFDIKENSIHSYFIFLKIALELNKLTFIPKEVSQLQKDSISLLFSLSTDILNLNKQFLSYLINNGVSEFTTSSEETNEESITYGDKEDKLLISLWCVSKYSLSSLSIIYEIFSMKYAQISLQPLNDFESSFLAPLSSSLEQIINIITTSKHMGVVKAMNECLYKISLVLNKSPETLSQYRNVACDKLNHFLQIQLQNEEISSTLRRSAGIPFLIVSLIKSYITPSFSNHFITNLLNSTVQVLLQNFTKYQYTLIDASVHSLHILRVVCDDTIIKPYIRQFYNEIILKIVDGLQSDNWSIKNACMLMFSRVIQNNFSFGSTGMDCKTLQTFTEYFMGKGELYDVIISILEKNVNGIELTDCLLLFVTFFTKFKVTKPSEVNNENLNKVVNYLFKMDIKNNKLFRKILSCAINRLSHNEEIIKQIKHNLIEEWTKYNNEEINNKCDFYYNVINELIKKEIINNDTKNELVSLYENIVIKYTKNNYFALTKYIQLYKKLLHVNETHIDSIYDYESKLGMNHSLKKINLDTIITTLHNNSRTFSLFKFIKHSLCYYLSNRNYSLTSSTTLNAKLKELKSQELFTFLLKRFSHKIPLSYIDISSLDLTEYSVNISSLISVYISNHINNIDNESKLSLIPKVIHIMQTLPEKTKLINKLFFLVPKLFNVTECDVTNFNKFIQLLLTYCDAQNIDYVRINSIIAFDKAIDYIISTDIKKECSIDHLSIMKVIYLCLNDEYQGIRMKACDVFMKYNYWYNIVPCLRINELNIKDVNNYCNEVIIRKMLKLKRRDELISKFYVFVLENNFYYNKANSDTKVFFFEPDNRYIDNIENKISILKNVIKNGKGGIKGKWCNKESKVNNKIKIFIVLEEFSENIKQIVHRQIEQGCQKEKYYYSNKIRKEIYNI